MVVTRQNHFTYLPYYIHLNPLDLFIPTWRTREKQIDNHEAVSVLNNYRWSSHLDYSGRENFPLVTKRDFLTKFFDGTNNYLKGVRQWLAQPKLEAIEHITLESL